MDASQCGSSRTHLGTPTPSGGVYSISATEKERVAQGRRRTISATHCECLCFTNEIFQKANERANILRRWPGSDGADCLRTHAASLAESLRRRIAFPLRCRRSTGREGEAGPEARRGGSAAAAADRRIGGSASPSSACRPRGADQRQRRGVTPSLAGFNVSTFRALAQRRICGKKIGTCRPVIGAAPRRSGGARAARSASRQISACATQPAPPRRLRARRPSRAPLYACLSRRPRPRRRRQRLQRVRPLRHALRLRQRAARRQQPRRRRVSPPYRQQQRPEVRHGVRVGIAFHSLATCDKAHETGERQPLMRHMRQRLV